jgi:TRAP-type C4-dicarboxylate transport system permease small subunit
VKRNRYIDSVEWLVIACLVVMVAVTFVSTAIRYLVPGMGGLYWAEEVSRYTSIWMVFLAGGLGVRYGVHLHVDLITARLPMPVQRAFRIGACILMLVFEGVLVYYGAIVAISNMDQQSSSLLVPMGYMYAAIPVGALLMMFETVRVLMRTMQGLDASEAEPAPAHVVNID